MLTKPQIRALEFFELEARDSAAALFLAPPAPIVRNNLLDKGLIDRRELWHFGFNRYQLTNRGHQVLEARRVKAQKRQHPATDQGSASASSLPGRKARTREGAA